VDRPLNSSAYRSDTSLARPVSNPTNTKEFVLHVSLTARTILESIQTVGLRRDPIECP
jgi:hypothetical protein